MGTGLGRVSDRAPEHLERNPMDGGIARVSGRAWLAVI